MPTPTITITVNEYFATKLSKKKKHQSHRKEEGHEITTIPNDEESSGSNVSVKKVKTHLCKRKGGCVHLKIITRPKDAEYTYCDWIRMLVSFLIYIVCVVLGATDLNKCPAEQMIPIYVLVEGVRGFLSTSINFTKLLFPSNAHFIVALRYFVDCFGLIWLIFGATWVYKVYGPNITCSPLIYWFAFGYITATISILIFLVIFFLILTCLLLCCLPVEILDLEELP